MGATAIGLIIGAVLGAWTGSMATALVAAALGTLVGAAVHAALWLWGDDDDDGPVVETHQVLCTPRGQVAAITFVGDRARGRWTEVRRCSLLPVAADVGCEQRCLRRINDAGVRPGGPCSCGLVHGAGTLTVPSTLP